MVCHLANKLAMLAGEITSSENMKRVMEAEFFPRNPDHELSPPVLIGDSAVREKRRILIIDNDRNSTRLVKTLLERAGGYLLLERKEPLHAHQSARNFR